jgi:hypothetical protein
MAALLAGVSLAAVAGAAVPELVVVTPIFLALIAAPAVAQRVFRLIRRYV